MMTLLDIDIWEVKCKGKMESIICIAQFISWLSENNQSLKKYRNQMKFFMLVNFLLFFDRLADFLQEFNRLGQK